MYVFLSTFRNQDYSSIFLMVSALGKLVPYLFHAFNLFLLIFEKIQYEQV
jgi:hypothetical protein